MPHPFGQDRVAPFTFGLSMGLTVGGVVGSVTTGGVNMAGSMVKNSDILESQRKIEKAMNEFKKKEIVVRELFEKFEKQMKIMIDDKKLSNCIEAVLKEKHQQ